MFRIARLLLPLLLLAPLALAEVAVRPAEWAQAVSVPGVQNCYQLDAKVYRAAQPDAAGFAALKRLGIATVLNLRDLHDDTEAAQGTGLLLQRVEMEADDITIDQVVAALRLLRQAEGPVLIHCWHGSDRTGTVSAMYRIVFQNWSKEAAIDELVNGGYGYHAIYRNIPELIRSADIEAIRRKVMTP